MIKKNHSHEELFPAPPQPSPLADRMRPRVFDDLVGQEKLCGPGGVLRVLIEKDQLISFLMWGPPGSGKTTIAQIVAEHTRAFFQPFSAVASSITELRQLIRQAEERWRFEHRRTIIFVDEIHHFNKSQQDAFLPHIEHGTVIFIGATTENPSFYVNSALLSRLKVFTLEKLKDKDIEALINRALTDRERGLGNQELIPEEEVKAEIARLSYGDARVAFNLLETCAIMAGERPQINRSLLEAVIEQGILYYDKQGEEHFNLISALHKSLRDSDVDAALYWTMRMVKAGENPRYILRRMIRFASEDVGLADPQALSRALDAFHAFEIIGPPEGYLALLQCAAYLACAPKSNALYKAEHLINDDIKKFGHLPVPKIIRNAPTGLMKSLGYGKNYQYAHDHEGAIVNQQHLPEAIADHQYYIPSERGLENKIKKYLDELREARSQSPQAR